MNLTNTIIDLSTQQRNALCFENIPANYEIIKSVVNSYALKQLSFHIFIFSNILFFLLIFSSFYYNRNKYIYKYFKKTDLALIISSLFLVCLSASFRYSQVYNLTLLFVEMVFYIFFFNFYLYKVWYNEIDKFVSSLLRSKK